MAAKKNIDWTKVALGQETDTILAINLGVDVAAVRKARNKYGIPAKGVKGRNSNAIDYAIDWDAVQFGKQTDQQLASAIGIEKYVVVRERTKRKIQSYTGVPFTKIQVDWVTLGLGTKSDTLVSKELKVSQSSVTRHRRKLGIAPAISDLAKCLTTEKEIATYGEALIDLFWHKNEIPHRFQVAIGPYRADWVIHDSLIVEFAGFADHRRFGSLYRAKLDKKLAFYHGHGWDVLVIWPKDLATYDVGLPPLARSSDGLGGL